MREIMIDNKGEREWVPLDEAREIAANHAYKWVGSCVSIFSGAVFIASTVLTVLSFKGDLLPEDLPSTNAIAVKVLFVALSVFSGLGTIYGCIKCCRIKGALCCPDKRVVIEGEGTGEHILARVRYCSIQ